MQALVRIQASMLADIVVAIPEVDLAVERGSGGVRAVGTRTGLESASQVCVASCMVWRVLILPGTSTIGTRVQINITLSQKQLEIQALRCNRDTSGRTMVPLVPWYVHVYVQI